MTAPVRRSARKAWSALRRSLPVATAGLLILAVLGTALAGAVSF